MVLLPRRHAVPVHGRRLVLLHPPALGAGLSHLVLRPGVPLPGRPREPLGGLSQVLHHACPLLVRHPHLERGLDVALLCSQRVEGGRLVKVPGNAWRALPVQCGQLVLGAAVTGVGLCLQLRAVVL